MNEEISHCKFFSLNFLSLLFYIISLSDILTQKPLPLKSFIIPAIVLILIENKHVVNFCFCVCVQIMTISFILL